MYRNKKMKIKIGNKEVVAEWLCPGCGKDHEAGSCDFYHRAQKQYWKVKRWYQLKGDFSRGRNLHANQ